MDLYQEIPAQFWTKMEGLLGEEYPAFRTCYTKPPVAGLRVNTLKAGPRQVQNWLPFELHPVPWCPAGFTLSPSAGTEEGLSAGKHPLHAAGLYYLQDPSAMAAVELLAPQPGEKVLDLAAAPGGKTTHIAALLQDQGLLVANEIHPQRAWDLAENLERWGVSCAVILNETPTRLAEHFGAFFDRVLLDAPCSGEGMFRKSAAARQEWRPNLPESCAARQSFLLNEAARLVRPGGILAYTTCTFSPEEDEGVVARFLEQQKQAAQAGFEVVQAASFPAFSTGRPDWAGLAQAGSLGLKQSIRLWPHKGAGEGHFIALLRKSQAASQEGPFATARRPQPVGDRQRSASAGFTQARELFRRFCLENFFEIPWQENLLLRGSYLYQAPARLPGLGDLRVLHPGLWLGSLKKERFEPAHALAMNLKPAALRRSALLPAEQSLRYLRGESLPNPGDNGWTLVTIEAGKDSQPFPLGWGKRVHGVLKNSYPKGLRGKV